MKTFHVGDWLEASIQFVPMLCQICGAPAWPGLWRWYGAVYCSPVCRDIERIPDVVPAYPFGQCAVGGPHFWEVQA